MKKVIKILAVLLCVILLVATTVTIWQWKNIKSILAGITESPEKISERMNDNKENLAKEINDYLDEEIREMTPEEKQQIEEGTATADEIYQKIYEEMHQKIKKEKTGEKDSEENRTEQDTNNAESRKKETGSVKQTAGNTNQKGKNEKSSATKDEIVSKYVAQLYSLQGKYTAQAEATIAEGKSYYLSLRHSKKDKAAARAETIGRFAPIARSVQAQCDAEVASVIANIENELRAIGENTDIAGTIKSAYENEKQLKISYYSGKYLN